MFLNQPKKECLGINLIKELRKVSYGDFTALVAYAKQSGVNRIAPDLELFRQNGGTVRFVIGIDQQQTTYEALSQLLKLSNEIYIFHSEGISKTFHVKCFWLSGERRCWYSVGSNNLTAGGLFDNYELSVSEALSGEEAEYTKSDLENVYASYVNNSSSCCRKLDSALLEELLSNGYIVKEAQQRKQLLEAVGRKQHTPKKKLFGTENISVPSFTRIQNGKDAIITDNASVAPSMIEKQSGQKATPKQVGAYLIRLVPKAGGRSKQVHFTKDLLDQYFCLSQGDRILVQQMLPNGDMGRIEQRQIILSNTNENVKIELAGAEMLNKNYPSNLDQRPVLIMKKAAERLFVYMILLAGDAGYDGINAKLKSMPTGRSLPYEVIDESAMFSLWSDCPLA